MIDQHTCKGCEQTFTPARKNRLYCNRQYQKRSTSNSKRDIRDREDARRNYVHSRRIRDLFEMVYGAAPDQRLGVMKDILARIPHDAGLRNILSDPRLLKEKPRADGRKNTAQAASAYTKMFFGASITTYIKQVQTGTVNGEFPVKRMAKPRRPNSHKQFLQSHHSNHGNTCHSRPMKRHSPPSCDAAVAARFADIRTRRNISTVGNSHIVGRNRH